MDDKQNEPVTAMALFDFGFERFITLDILKFIYFLAILLYTIAALFLIFGAFQSGASAGLGAIVLAPIIWVIYVVMTRVSLEVIAVIFRIADNTSTLIEQNKRSGE